MPHESPSIARALNFDVGSETAKCRGCRLDTLLHGLAPSAHAELRPDGAEHLDRLITADATEQLMRQAYQAHAYSVIPKPVSKNVVLYTVVRALVRAYPPQDATPNE